jgi:phosphoribosyl 1,2-cyclic phosphate phosphodiesterase
MDGKLILLGTGGSAGTPAIGNWWGNCDPANPLNRRTRPSIAVQTETTLVVVDTGPDFREQMNREKLGVPDAIIITHAHSDHVNGLDELRTLQRLHKRKFDIHALDATFEKLERRLDYMFEETEGGFYPAVCNPVRVRQGAEIRVGDIVITPFEQDHGTLNSLGLKIGNIGYSTDVKKLSGEALEILSGIDTWIVDAAGHHSRTNPVHMCIEEVVETNEKIGAKRVYLTHLPPTMDHQTLIDELPENIAPAYDGMVLAFKY